MNKVNNAPHGIVIQRVYDDPTPHDGYRVLVDHFWSRGRSKDVLKLDDWARDIAPSAELIHWFGHDPARWEEFRARYRKELAELAQRERLRALLAAAGKQRITLVHGARGETENQAVVLRAELSIARAEGRRTVTIGSSPSGGVCPITLHRPKIGNFAQQRGNDRPI